MKPLSESDLKKFQDAIKKDYGVYLDGEKLYEAAYNLLKFFDELIRFDTEDRKYIKIKHKTKVRKSS